MVENSCKIDIILIEALIFDAIGDLIKQEYSSIGCKYGLHLPASMNIV